MINKLLMMSWGVCAFIVCAGGYILWDSYSCNFEMSFPGSDSLAKCEQGVYYTRTRIEQGDERYKINTESFYVKILDRILLLPKEKDIDVEMKGSLAVYNADKIKTPHRTFGNQPYTSLSLLYTPKNELLGVAIFSDPNSVFVPATYVTGTF
ncbi:hypothetical protein [Litoribacillus peritrichatus]|uniref:Uncharacterized protein n=1 Tax=Litoribacillus peritrichatus TaxID=718191 RepID=A0ABP7MXI5_9GAMM